MGACLSVLDSGFRLGLKLGFYLHLNEIDLRMVYNQTFGSGFNFRLRL